MGGIMGRCSKSMTVGLLSSMAAVGAAADSIASCSWMEGGPKGLKLQKATSSTSGSSGCCAKICLTRFRALSLMLTRSCTVTVLL